MIVILFYIINKPNKTMHQLQKAARQLIRGVKNHYPEKCKISVWMNR